MAARIKIRTKLADGVTMVRVLMIHPMETGLRKDRDTGEPIPVHYIREVLCEHNDRVVLKAYWGIAISKNPYLSFRLNGAVPGDTITISWIDNRGASASEKAIIE